MVRLQHRKTVKASAGDRVKNFFWRFRKKEDIDMIVTPNVEGATTRKIYTHHGVYEVTLTDEQIKKAINKVMTKYVEG